MPELRPTPAQTIITGAAGWLGQALMHRLRADGTRRHIHALVHDGSDAGVFAGWPDVEVTVGNIAERSVVDSLFAGAGSDTDVIHTAGIIHPQRVRDFFAVNATGTRNMVAAAQAAGIRRFVHVSSNSPFGTNPHPTDVFRNDEPYNPYYGYGRSKMEGEQAVFAAAGEGLDAVVVRPPWFYGPYQPPRQTTFFRMVRAGRFPVVAGGRQRRSMVYVDNLVDGLLLAELVARAQGHGYWIADARPYEVTEIVETVGRALRAEGFTTKEGALRLPAVAGRIAELGDRIIQGTGRYQQQLHVLGEMDKTIACDISAARRDLGYEPEVDLYEGMRRSIRWCVEQGLEL